ncbi:MATE family efflux transporter [Rapidithrix thailandica]|uniref:Multidrug-efflux transporter n=1 Tax=Rapidithrix thailandica TaxID=413964 RepID=A0AAW9RTK7_9BACT
MSIKEYIPHYKKNLSLSLPVMLALAGQMSVGIVDNIMVGHIGTTPLAAASFANGVFVNMLVFGMGFAYGLTPLVGQAYSKRNVTEIGGLFKNGLTAYLSLGLLLTFVALALSLVMQFMGQKVDVLHQATPYYHIISYSLVPLMLFFACKQFAEGIESTKPTMVFTLLSNLINVGLNYVLIFGKFGVEPMGLVGAGIATLVARVFMAVSLLIYLLQSKTFAPYQQAFKNSKINIGQVKELSRIGLPIAFQTTLETGAFNMGTIMMGWIGKVELAAHQITLSLASLTYMIANGISTAATVRVSNQYGKREFTTLRKAAHSVFHMSAVFMIVSAILLVFTRHYLPPIFVQADPEIQDPLLVTAMASKLIIVAALFQLFDGIQVVGLGALRGLTDVKIPSMIALLSYWVISLPVAYVLAFVFDLKETGIWIGFLVGLTMAAILLVLRFEIVSKKLEQQNTQTSDVLVSG